MSERDIIRIDEDKCNGCGECVPNCHEGALKIVDGKARLISDLFCDGLGACIGHCPQGAIEIEKREAEPYDERRVMAENIVPKGENTIKAHLEHLRDHNANEYLQEAIDFLEEKGIENPMSEKSVKESGCMKKECGCPGSMEMDFSDEKPTETGFVDSPSQLRQWPVQLHLINPGAPYFQESDLLLAADCTAFSLGSFHEKFLKGKSLIIACPKLDHGEDVYKDKLKSLIDDAKINTLTVLIMEVPCCAGLLSLAQSALAESERKIPIKLVVVGIKGGITREEWVS